MRYVSITAAALGLAFAGAIAVAQETKPAPSQSRGSAGTVRATATIKGEGISGTAQLVERKQGTGTVVEITVTASGLKPGLHGVHLHAVGKCEPDFAAAGGHFDPGPASNSDPDANHP